MMTPIQSIYTCFRKYTDFKGRASRSEFWWFQIFCWVVSFGWVTVKSTVEVNFPAVNAAVIGGIIALILVVPLNAVQVRRLHDRGHSGRWLIAFYVVVILGPLTAKLITESGSELSLIGMIVRLFFAASILVTTGFIVIQSCLETHSRGDIYGKAEGGETNVSTFKPAERVSAFQPVEYNPQSYTPNY